jgi:hypothetical protein
VLKELKKYFELFSFSASFLKKIPSISIRGENISNISIKRPPSVILVPVDYESSILRAKVDALYGL